MGRKNRDTGKGLSNVMSAALVRTVLSEPTGNYTRLSRPSSTIGDRKPKPVAVSPVYFVEEIVAGSAIKEQKYKHFFIESELKRTDFFHSGIAYSRGKQAYVSSIPITSVSTEFRDLVERWRRETLNFSDIREIVEHEAYQRIVGLGWPVVGLILNDLRKEPDFWFEALTQITGEDPLISQPESLGNMRAMADCWLEWGENNGF